MASRRVDVRVLGSLRAALAGTELPLGGAKPRLVLALLAARAGRTVSTEALIDGVWGEDPPPTARKALQVHVAGLRRALRSPDTIVTTAGGYALVADVDAERFTSAIESARRLVDQAPAGALTHLDLALSLWQDEPFADLAHEEALTAERTRLQTLRAEADSLRFRCLLELGHHDEAAAGLDVAVRAEPYREDLRILQMLALYRAGRQVDALRVYADARRTLAEELGVSPSPELADLERRILEHDPSLIVPPTAETPAASTLPSRVAGLIGRDEAVAEITRLLDSARLVTLTAVGGAGKTRLAIECAHRIAEAFPGGAFFVDLTSVIDDADVAVTVSAGIGLTGTGREVAPARLVEYLGPRRCLVVLDNCEHVLEGAATLAARLTQRCPQLALLATSRAVLAVPGEQVVQVPLLEANDPRSPSVELFVARAGEASPGFRLGDEADIVVDICRGLDGIPLAIELAAARARSMSPTEIRDRLVDRFSLLAGHSHNLTRHHRTLLAAVDWSYSLLDPDEQALLRRLAVFHGGFDLADVAEVTGFDDAQAARLVDSLVGKSLVDVVRTRDGSIRRRRLLDTIRSFAAMRLDAADEATAVRDRHYEHFVGGALARSYTASTHDAEIFDRNVRELANIVAAIEHGIATGRRDIATLAAIVLFWPLVERGMIDRYLPFSHDGDGLTREQRALVLTGRMMHAYLVSDPTLVPTVPADLMPSDDGDVLDDVFHPLTGPVAFAPVEGAGPRLALLDGLLPHAARSPTPAANVACVEIQRAGQFYSLGDLDRALASARRAARLSRASGRISWDDTVAELALLVLLGRRDEALDELQQLDAWDVYERDLCRALCAVGGGDPAAAAAALADSARRHVSGRLELQECDYLSLFAAFRHDVGDGARAEQLVTASKPRYPMVNWLVWPHVGGWTPETFVERNAATRARELARMTDGSWDGSALADLLREELAFWPSGR